MNKLLKYNQAKLEIMNLIAGDSLEIGARLPPERDLVSRFNLSMITVRRALKDLERQGFLERRNRLGTFLRKSIQKEDMERILFIRIYKEEYKETPRPPEYSHHVSELLSQKLINMQFIAAKEPDIATANEAKGCIGIFVQGWLTQEWLDFLKMLNTPTVVLGANPFPDQLPTVSYDWKYAGEGLTEEFISCGYKKIGLINGGPTYYPAKQMYEGYCLAMAKAKRKIDDKLVIWPGHPQMHKHICDYLDANPDCDALIIENGALIPFLQCNWNRPLAHRMPLGMIGDSEASSNFFKHLDHGLLMAFEESIYIAGVDMIFSMFSSQANPIKLIRPQLYRSSN